MPKSEGQLPLLKPKDEAFLRKEELRLQGNSNKNRARRRKKDEIDRLEALGDKINPTQVLILKNLKDAISRDSRRNRRGRGGGSSRNETTISSPHQLKPLDGYGQHSYGGQSLITGAGEVYDYGGGSSVHDLVEGVPQSLGWSAEQQSDVLMTDLSFGFNSGSFDGSSGQPYGGGAGAYGGNGDSMLAEGLSSLSLGESEIETTGSSVVSGSDGRLYYRIWDGHGKQWVDFPA